MRDSALYFPYIEVPDRPSLTRVLLYWDRLGSIVPPVDLSERMRELVAAELVEPVEPGGYLNDQEFAAGFLRILDAAPADGGARTQSIHIAKGTDDLWDELTGRGVAEEAGHPWMRVTRTVAALYMAYLAGYLGRQRDLRMEPITDQRTYFAPFLAPDPAQALAQRVDSMRAVVLREVLPAPAEPVPVRELATFKHDNWDLLRSFRLDIERRLLECAGEADAELRERLLDQHAAELGERVAEIEARMRRIRWPTATGLFCTALPAIYAVGKFLATGEPVDVGDVGVPLISEVIRSAGVPGEAADGEALAYAALARGEFGGPEQ